MEMSPLIRANATGVLISTNIKNKRELNALWTSMRMHMVVTVTL